MIDGKTVLAIIPARGGSKGVPRKNIRELGGKPLIAWTIEEAKKSKYIDRLILSSEDPEIIDVAKSFGCEVPFVRPKELAQDETPGIDPVLHALDMLPGYDLVVLLQPTSPLRSVCDIDGCIEHCVHRAVQSAVSIVEVGETPYWMYKMNSDDTLCRLINGAKYQRRQDIPKVYSVNGAVYVAEYSWLKEKKSFVDEKTVGFVMPNERSYDIDTEFDIQLVKFCLDERAILRKRSE
jgi:N-acylneuraminate cytidylyltransferase